MAKKALKETAAAKRKQSTAADEQQTSKSPKLDWDFENTMSLSDIAAAIDSDLSDINVGFNTNSDDEDFPVLKIKAGKSIAKKLPKEAHGYVTFTPSMNMQERMDDEGQEWNKAYVMSHAKTFGFIPHPDSGFSGIGKLCLRTGNYEACDLSGLLEDEDDE